MPRYIKEDKTYPGELRIINALYKEPLTFTQLITRANINRVTLSEYLKRLTRKGIVEHDKTTRQYSCPKTLQPLFRSSFPDEEFLGTIDNIVRLAYVTKRLYGKHSAESKAHTQKFLLETQLAAFLAELQHGLVQAVPYKDLSVAQEYIRRFSEKYLIPRLQLLMLEAFQNRDVFLEFAEEERQRTFDILHKNQATLKLLLREHRQRRRTRTKT